MKVAKIMSPDPITVDANAGVDDAMALMDEHDVRHLPVLDGGRVVGMLSDRDLLEATGWLHPREREALEVVDGPVRDLMRSPPITVAPTEDLYRALALIVEQRVGCLLVVDGDRLAGVVSEMDVLRCYAESQRTETSAPRGPLLSTLMSSEPRTIAHDASGTDAEALMREHDIRHLPVLRDGKLIGILSDRDVRLARGQGALETSTALDLMTPAPQVLAPTAHLSSAALLMSAERIGALPIVEGGRLRGIATLVDVLVPCAAALGVAD